MGKYCLKSSYLQQHLALQEDQGHRGIQPDPLRESNEMHQCGKKKQPEVLLLRHNFPGYWYNGHNNLLCNLHNDLVLVYLATTIDGNFKDPMMMLQINENMLQCIPLPCKHKI